MSTGAGGAGRERPRCGAVKRDGSGETCRLPAGHGTEHPGVGRCKRHGGCTPTQVAHARHVQAEQAAAKFGLRVETTAEAALIDALALAEGRVAYCLARCSELTTEQLAYVTTRVTRRIKPAGAPGAGQLVEDTTHMASARNIWVQLLDEAERHRVAVAEVVVKLGLEARRVELAQAHGEALNNVLLLALTRAGFTTAQQQALIAELPAAISAVTGEVTESVGDRPC